MEKFTLTIDGYDVKEYLKKLKIVEEMFLLVPYVEFEFESSDLVINNINLKTDSVVSMDVQFAPSVTDKEDAFKREEKLVFKLKDSSIEHNPRTSETYVKCFALLDINSELYNSKKHIYHNQSTSDMFTNIMRKKAKTIEVTPTNDKMKSVQWFESDLEFLNRNVKHSYFSESDYMCQWVSRNVDGHYKSFNQLTNKVDFILDANSRTLDIMSNVTETTTQNQNDQASQDVKIPCGSFLISSLFGSMTMEGGSGGVLSGYDQLSSGNINKGVSVVGFKNHKMGKYIPILDHEWGRVTKHKNVPQDFNGITHDNYQKSKMENDMFWSMVSSNSINTVVGFNTKVHVGKCFRVDVNKFNESDQESQSSFLRDTLFVVGSLVHSYSSEDEKLWTRIYGVTFGLNKNDDETKFRYITQG